MKEIAGHTPTVRYILGSGNKEIQGVDMTPFPVLWKTL